MVAGGSGGTNSGAPKAFVNIIVFDKNYKLLDAAWDGISPTAEQVGATPVVAHDLMSSEYTIKEEGYVFMYVSNENPTLVDVYFDDIVMTHTKSNVVQYNEYYPFGLQTAISWTRENTTSNNFLGNGGTELNNTSNLYDLSYRNYDPVLGRMNGVDPMAAKYASLTPYNFSFNDPVTYSDPSGADPLYNETTMASFGQTPVGGMFKPHIMDNGVFGRPGGSLSAGAFAAGDAYLNSFSNSSGILDALRKLFPDATFGKGGDTGFWIKTYGVDRTNEGSPFEGDPGIILLGTILERMISVSGVSRDHFNAMLNPIAQSIHSGQQEFANNPFGGGLLAFLSGGGLMGAGGLVGKAALRARVMSTLFDAGSQLAVNYASGSSLSKSLGQINITSITLSFASPGMKFSTMVRNGMLSTAFTVNLNGGSQTLMNGGRSMTDVMISGGIGGAFSGLNSFGRNLAATSLWSGRSLLSNGISPSSQAYQATAYMWAGSKGASILSGGLSNVTTNIYESGN